MKATVKLFILIILILVTTYFILDRKLYYYGKSDLNMYDLLPMKIKPEFRTGLDEGFTLFNEYGFSLVGKGDKYINSDITVNKVVRYGFDQNELIAFVEDENSNRYYIDCLKENDKQSKREIVITVYNTSNQLNLKKFSWIEIRNNEKLINSLELFRNYVLFISILLSIILLYKVIRGG
jgi:hypothetical protein